MSEAVVGIVQRSTAKYKNSRMLALIKASGEKKDAYSLEVSNG
jgi:hypothetical protein